MTHRELVKIAYKWVLKNGSCGFAFRELKSASAEIPDVVGFGCGHSFLIEVKVSRSDFLSDKNKPHRVNPEKGIGSKRYYCCPTGMIKKEELPENWGLIYVDEKQKARIVHRPMVAYGEYNGNVIYREYAHSRNIESENFLMYSALRRLHLRGRIEEIYAIP